MEQAVMCQEVEFPDERVNLIVALRYLANSKSTPIVMRKDGDKIIEYYDFDMAVHQIFDDMGNLSNDPDQYIGVFLRDEAESNAVKVLIAKLESVLVSNPPDQIDEIFASTSKWLAVIKAARDALACFAIQN